MNESLVRWFWIPYAVVIVLMVIGFAWSGSEEQRIQAYAERREALVKAECEYDTKVQAIVVAMAASDHTKIAVIGTPPFCVSPSP